jgi:hypothetical protein
MSHSTMNPAAEAARGARKSDHVGTAIANEHKTTAAEYQTSRAAASIASRLPVPLSVVAAHCRAAGYGEARHG